MYFVCKLYGNTYAVHVTVVLVGVATLNLALPAPLAPMVEKYAQREIIFHNEKLLIRQYSQVK